MLILYIIHMCYKHVFLFCIHSEFKSPDEIATSLEAPSNASHEKISPVKNIYEEIRSQQMDTATNADSDNGNNADKNIIGPSDAEKDTEDEGHSNEQVKGQGQVDEDQGQFDADQGQFDEGQGHIDEGQRHINEGQDHIDEEQGQDKTAGPNGIDNEDEKDMVFSQAVGKYI